MHIYIYTYICKYTINNRLTDPALTEYRSSSLG